MQGDFMAIAASYPEEEKYEKIGRYFPELRGANIFPFLRGYHGKYSRHFLNMRIGQ